MSDSRWQSLRFGFRFLVVVAVLGGATVGVSMLAEAKRGGGGGKRAPVESRDCKADKDCVMVADDCCPCSQGGKARAIPRKQQDTYEKERKKRCADTACTEMMSDDPSCSQVPFCGVGICELGDPPSAAPKSDDPPKSDAKPKADEKPKGDEKKSKAAEKPKADDKPSTSGIEF
jgi:hypothetical protein